MGRTGTLWGIEHSGVVPDLVTVGKSLASGMPLAGVIGRAEVMDSVHPGGLGSTYGGNPVACAAAIESLRAIASDEFLARSVAVGERIQARLRDLATRHSVIGEVRGIGPMAAIELVKDPDHEGAGGRGRGGHGRGGARAGPDPAQDRHPRQRDPHPGADHRPRRGSRGRARPARGVAWRSRRLALRPPSACVACARPMATSSRWTGSTWTCRPASSSPCSGRPARARRPPCA